MLLLLVDEAVMLHTGDRVQHAVYSNWVGTVMGEVRYQGSWYKVVLWDGDEEGKDIATIFLKRLP